MERFGLIVEGNYDKQILEPLLEKILLKNHKHIFRVTYGNPRLLEKYPGFLEEFRYKKLIQKAIILKDTDYKNPEKLLEQMRYRKQKRSYPFPIMFCVAKKEIEAWLLADEKAISTVVKKTIRRIKGDLEELLAPKKKLQRILSDANIAYTAEIARKIALEADIDIIGDRCRYFRIFRDSVINQ